jgi:carbamoyltransferase
MTKILSIHSGPHDSAAAVFDGYDLRSAIHQERLTRKKCDGGFPKEAIDEALRIAGVSRNNLDAIVLSRASYPTDYMYFGLVDQTRFSLQKMVGHQRHKSLAIQMIKRGTTNAEDVFNKEAFCRDNGFNENIALHFANHHNAHALSALFYLPGDDILVYTSDGGGDGVNYSARILKNGNSLSCLFGDDRNFLTQYDANSLARAYGYSTQAIGFRMNRHEGKLTGLAAYGKPTLYDEMASHFKILDNGEISSDFTSHKEMKKEIFRLAKGEPRENVAASAQELLEKFTLEAIKKLMTHHEVNRLAVAGGAFANVRLNKLLCDQAGVDEMFIFPAMGDDGLVVGGALEFLFEKHGEQDFLAHRRRLENVYLGDQFDTEAEKLFHSDERLEQISGDPAEVAAKLIANDRIGAIYTGRMEFGPRALGARTILANPKDDDINKTLNKRLQRTEFMPFAPYVLEEDAADVFEITEANRYACRYMTITTVVNPKWANKISAVVHVDGTARPQIITEEDNPLYCNILRCFKQETGLPVLVNTSFNVHEEPIIYRPTECLQALIEGRVDFIVTPETVYRIKT